MPVRISRPDPSRFDEGDALGALRRELEDPEHTLNAVGAALVAESHKAFRTEQMGPAKWQERVNPNWPAVIADLTEGTNIKARRFRSRPVLRDTGLLARSFAWSRIGPDVVESGTTVPYAAVLHSGGESLSLPITQTVQTRLWEWIKRARGGALRAAKSAGKAKGKDAQRKAQSRLSGALLKAEGGEQLAWLLNPSLTGQRKPINHPARPMVGLPAQLIQDIERTLGVRVGRSA